MSFRCHRCGETWPDHPVTRVPCAARRPGPGAAARPVIERGGNPTSNASGPPSPPASCACVRARADRPCS